MQQIFYFIEKYKYFLLFMALELVALLFTIQSHSYHKSQFVNSANAITGGLYKKHKAIFQFTSLIKENENLATENTLLRNRLESLKNNSYTPKDSTYQKYIYTTAKVINNSFTKKNNILTIDKGRNDGLQLDMGVISSTGLIGIINNISNNYATVLSVLNSQSKINARLKKNHYFGTLSWNGNDYKKAQLVDIQRQANIQIGDTIVSGGKSTLFPEGIIIGTIHSFDKTRKTYENIEILLSTDMSNLGYVHVVENKEKPEIKNGENSHD